MLIGQMKSVYGIVPAKMSTWTCTLENVRLELHPQKCPLALEPTKMSTRQIWEGGRSALGEAVTHYPPAARSAMRLQGATPL